ncbi:hypothetical protein ACN47E_008586 [Coniothyrium glycines]
MTSTQDDNSVPAVRFKKRKFAHTKRINLDDNVQHSASSLSPDVASLRDTVAPPLNDNDDTESVLTLKEIIRNRKRPRDHIKEPARRPAASSTELVHVDAPRTSQYISRFVAQTGQAVDRDDRQMTEYVEARLAEQNYRQYGWPIPKHLQATVAAIAPDLKSTFVSGTYTHSTADGADNIVDAQHSQRLAAGQGKLQEVDLGPAAAARVEEDWKRLDAGEPPGEPASTARKGKYGYQWRKSRRRNSDAERRDQLVEAVLKEAKLDYFDDTVPSNPGFQNSNNNDDAVAERFRAEYFEALEEQKQRKHPPSASGAKGVKEPSRGPKLGGSKSARAKMRLRGEKAAKAKK